MQRMLKLKKNVASIYHEQEVSRFSNNCKLS